MDSFQAVSVTTTQALFLHTLISEPGVTDIDVVVIVAVVTSVSHQFVDQVEVQVSQSQSKYNVVLEVSTHTHVSSYSTLIVGNLSSIREFASGIIVEPLMVGAVASSTFHVQGVQYSVAHQSRLIAVTAVCHAEASDQSHGSSFLSIE